MEDAPFRRSACPAGGRCCWPASLWRSQQSRVPRGCTRCGRGRRCNRPRKLSAREPPALTADEERFATALWAVHREATRLAVAMSFAGITYQTEDRDARALARKIEPLAKFFHDAEMQVRAMSTPPSLSRTQGQYVDAMALFANAAAEILKFTEDGDSQRLGDAHRMDVRASEDMLRVGEVLWPGQYKPH